MFTGLITDLGRVRSADAQAGGMRLAIETAYPVESLEIGASIACSGACLTVIESGAESGGGAHARWFSVDVSAETLNCTTLGGWRAGGLVNLERSLKLGDHLDGHLVSGHVDGVAAVVERRPDGDSIRYVFEAPADLSRFIAAKGSVALDGVSLTVNEVDGHRFGVNIIPHTAEKTTFGALQPGERVNLEVDQVARYVARLQIDR
jgi:riboflavin synthase